MKLTKAIEAAREAGDTLKKQVELIRLRCEQNNNMACDAKIVTHHMLIAAQRLAALPDKPMTERDIQVLICGILQKRGTAIDIFRALKAANVLYVEEK